MSIITEELLKKLRVGDAALDFFNKAGLIGMTFEELRKVEGDHDSIFYYVRDAVFNKPKVKLDNKGRVVQSISGSGVLREFSYSKEDYTIAITRSFSEVDIATLYYNDKLKTLIRGDRVMKYHYNSEGLLIRIERNTEDDTYLYYNEQGLLRKEEHYDGDVTYYYNSKGLLCEENLYGVCENHYEYEFYKERLVSVAVNGSVILTIPNKESL